MQVVSFPLFFFFLKKKTCIFPGFEHMLWQMLELYPSSFIVEGKQVD
jgi:hypothetical protein